MLINDSLICDLAAGRRSQLKAVCERFGPQLLGAGFPVDESGEPADLTQEQVCSVMDQITRNFWRDLIQSHEVEAAAQAAAEQARTANAGDPFEGGQVDA